VCEKYAASNRRRSGGVVCANVSEVPSGRIEFVITVSLD